MKRIVIVIVITMMLVGCGQSEDQFYEIIERERLSDEVMMLFSDLYQTPGSYHKTYEGASYMLLVGEQVNTGGYMLEIIEASIDKGQVSFLVDLMPPGLDVSVTEALTYPTLILSTTEIIDQVNMEIK